VGCACVAREVRVERGGMGERGCARRLGGWVWDASSVPISLDGWWLRRYGLAHCGYRMVVV